jgi:TfoX/Sxy family transcriptional regulator of competence genes
MTEASDAMGERLRPLLKGLEEKKMFGGLGFMLNGNMLVGTTAKGALLVRVDPQRMGEALARPGASQMHMGPKVMTGFIAVDPEALPDAAAIRDWITYARAYVKTLPPKSEHPMPSTRSNETMDHLADRVRGIVGGDPRVTEKNMFGGLTFLYDGHILVGCKKDGRILLSVGREHFGDALARPGASPMIHGGRQMTGFVWVDADAIEEDDALRDWVTTARAWVSTMPAEAPKAPRKVAPANKPRGPKPSPYRGARRPERRAGRRGS